jgi:hypothetical protein
MLGLFNSTYSTPSLSSFGQIISQVAAIRTRLQVQSSSSEFQELRNAGKITGSMDNERYLDLFASNTDLEGFAIH